MLLKLTLNDETLFVSGHKDLDSIISNIPDVKGNENFIHECVVHGDCEVRSSLARNQFLKKETILILSKDSSLDVRRALIGRRYRSKNNDFVLSKEVIENLLIGNDPEILEDLAGSISELKDDYKDELYQILLRSNLPNVLYRLAGWRDTPIQILEELTNHEDSNVSSEAKETLVDMVNSRYK